METITNFFLQILNLLFTFILILVGGVILFILIQKIISRLLFTKVIEENLAKKGMIFLSVKIPPRTEQKETAMEDFLRSLHRVLPKKATLSLEMASIDQFLHFYIGITRHQKGILESQLYAHYPEAETEETADYLSPFDENTAITQLNFKRKSTIPLNTYHELEEDLLKNLSAFLSKADPGEKIFLQLVLKRIGSKAWDHGFSALGFHLFGKKYNTEGQPSLAQYKMSQDLFLGKIRLAYLAKEKFTAQDKLTTLVNLFKLVKGPNELKKAGISLLGSPADLGKQFLARIFESGDFYTPAEAATLYHFPYQDNVVSNVVATTSKRAPAPDVLPREGIVQSKEVSFFGETNYRNDRQRFGIKRGDRRRHLYVVGKTGSGKSKLLELLLISDIQQGHGCCLLDPHGDLANELLLFVPKERINDVVYVNPADRDFPIAFNPLEPVRDYEVRQHLATFFIAIFKKLFSFNWNPRMEHIIRYVTLALLETPDSNILGISRMLSDTAFRQRVIMQIQDPVVKTFWTTEFSAWNERFANDAVIPILNKIGQFIANPIVRNMVGQRKNSLDFSKFMDEGKIVIINISKGKLGDDNAALLGSMFITKIQQAALSRAKVTEEERRDFYFYVDEFQNFATDAFSSILSEARKYRLNLTIAHQYIAQLPDDVKATAFGNVGSMIVFAVGGDDAAYLAKEFAPVFTSDDMINLNVREMYIKMSIDGKATPPFSAQTIDVPKPVEDYSTEILSHSRMKYGKNRVSVENEISQWSQTTETPSGQLMPGEEFPEPII